MIYVISSVAILATMTMAIVRGFRGPTVYDRALAVNMFGTATVLLIAVLGFMTGRPDFLDLALIYALLSFIGTIAILKYVSGEKAEGPDEGKGEDEWPW